MTVYVVQRVAKETAGEFAAGAIEKVFESQAKAEAYVRSRPSVWEESINGFACYCERGLFVCETEQ
jgi:hypothetical protein